MSDSKKISVERKGHVAVLTFNDPTTLNAMTEDFLISFAGELEQISKEEEIRIIILTGSGRAFVAGADIEHMRKLTHITASQYGAITARVYQLIENMDQVFIAAVNGFALGGGCEIAMACDLRVASKKAKFGLPEVTLGVFPAGGGTQRLPRLIGETRAKSMIFTGEIIDAEQAERIGLVNKVVEPEQLMEEAEKLAERILRNSRFGVETARKSINSGKNLSLEAALRQDLYLFDLCFNRPDQQEGMLAFLEKRPPKFE